MNVSRASHEYAVQLIRETGNELSLRVLTISAPLAEGRPPCHTNGTPPEPFQTKPRGQLISIFMNFVVKRLQCWVRFEIKRFEIKFLNCDFDFKSFSNK